MIDRQYDVGEVVGEPFGDPQSAGRVASDRAMPATAALSLSNRDAMLTFLPRGRTVAGHGLEDTGMEDLMAATARARAERIEFRTTPEVRRLVERAIDASGTNLTDFAETSLTLAAQRVMADRDSFVLSEDASAEWEAINARPARELEGLRRLMARPSPFDE